LYLLAGTSFGHIRNDNFPPQRGQFAQRSIFNELDEAHITWKVYAAQYPFAFAFLFSYVRETAAALKVRPISSYYADAAAGTLPQVAFIDPVLFGLPNAETDEHPN